MSKLTREQITEALRPISGWQYTEDSIEKEFRFDSYLRGIDFVNRIAQKAEEHDHHPDLEVGWCRVKVTFTSHDAGGVTDRDVRMARVTEGLL